MNSAVVAPRPSATLVLVRLGAQDQVEVLLLQRADRGDQNSLAWVFPGGLVDETDRALRGHFHDADDAAASRRLGLSEAGLDYFAAALRETLEEAGLLLAVDDSGRPVDAALYAHCLLDWRERARGLARGQGGAAFAALCSERGWRLSASSLHPVAHWITPAGLPKRFDTRFFLGVAPPGAEVLIDGVEIVDHRWIQPSALLDRDLGLRIQGPALAVARDLARHRSVDALLGWARGLGPIEPVRPFMAHDAAGKMTPVMPSHPAWAEVGRIDPLGRGLACDVIRPGVPVALTADRVVRLTAGNPGVMTGPGTNSYLLRAAANDWVLIDPGPDDAAHVQALLSWLARQSARLVAILVTHTHLDHSPAAHALRAATGAALHGRVAEHPQGQDARFVPDVALRGGERLDFGGGLVLHAIHTPGHASNHLCYLHEAERMLFTGDHVMQGSTVVINPPDGDMAAYLRSLADLADAAGGAFDVLAPGHGFLVERPERVLRQLIAHRRAREAKVVRALSAATSRSLTELVSEVYDDVPADRHGIASRSLLAHLLHLQAQRKAREDDGRWSVGRADVGTVEHGHCPA